MKPNRIAGILKSLPLWLIILLIAVQLTLLAGDLWYLTHQRTVFQQEVESRLTAIAELKVDQISSWRTDQINDAESISTLISPLAISFFSNPSTENEQNLQNLLQALAMQHDYTDVLLLDTAGMERWTLVAGAGYNKEFLSLFGIMAQTGEAVLVDLHQGEDHPPPHLSSNAIVQ